VTGASSGEPNTQPSAASGGWKDWWNML